MNYPFYHGRLFFFFCFNLVNDLILMRVCHWFFFFPEGSVRSIPGFSPSWRSTRGEDSEGRTDCWFCSKTSREPADCSDPPTLQSPSAGSPSGYRQGKGDTFEDKARTWSSWICRSPSSHSQWFPLINIKGMPCSLRRVHALSSPQCWAEWQGGCLSPC